MYEVLEERGEEGGVYEDERRGCVANELSLASNTIYT
jgi:hypothetical protein